MTFRTSDTAETRKARGAFFTPPELCRYVAGWAIRSASDEAGAIMWEAAFLLAAGERLDTLAALTGEMRGGLDGIELHGDSARWAEAFVRAAGHEARVIAGNFFLVSPTGRYDAVIGNPPYVRIRISHMLGVPIGEGAGSQSGRLAKAADAWVSARRGGHAVDTPSPHSPGPVQVLTSAPYRRAGGRPEQSSTCSLELPCPACAVENGVDA